jgi:hypothetical protein
LGILKDRGDTTSTRLWRDFGGLTTSPISPPGIKTKLKWRMMIPATPDWVTADLFANAVAQAEERLGEAPRSLRLDTYEEGRSVQIMHAGPPSEQCETMARLHGEYLPAVTKAIEHMIRLGILREITGKQRRRLFAYNRYVGILNQGTEPLPR